MPIPLTQQIGVYQELLRVLAAERSMQELAGETETNDLAVWWAILESLIALQDMVDHSTDAQALYAQCLAGQEGAHGRL